MLNHKSIPYLILSVLTLTASLGLWYWRSDLFSFERTIPAAFTYFGLFYLLINSPSLRARRESRCSKSQEREPKKEISSDPRKVDWWTAVFCGEIAVFIVLTIVSTTIGGIAGMVWWGAGGYEIRSLVEALRIGCIVGAAVVIVLAAGG